MQPLAAAVNPVVAARIKASHVREEEGLTHRR
jgi:hypothetical protein